MKKKDYSKEISTILRGVGMPAHLLGYRYMKEILQIVLDDENRIHALSTSVYPEVAEKFGTTYQRVERAIRHAVEAATNNMPPEREYRYFGYCINFNRGKATNSEFIAILAEHIRNGTFVDEMEQRGDSK